MSSKSSKRRMKRLNTNEDETESANNKKTPVKAVEEPCPPPPPPVAESPKIIVIDDDKEDLKGFDEERTENKEKTPGEITNGQSSEENTENGTESEIEPLVFDVEEPELTFPSETNSEVSDVEKSPRCATRRSQTRNIPTPKTPLQKESNGPEDKQQCLTSEVRVNVTRLDTVPETGSSLEDSQESELSVDDHNSQKVEDQPPQPQETAKSEEELDTTNTLSMLVNLGNDTTRNIDLTQASLPEENQPSFVDNTKDLSYGEALRTLSGRRTFNRSMYKDTSDGPKKYTPMKRKAADDAEETKRFKSDGSPSLFTKISSPFSSFRNKVEQTQLPSSTPKLTSYKYPNESKEDLCNPDSESVAQTNTNSNPETKKWCSIM